ncbi:Panacea domain-containing protein [Flavobacterium sp. LHD-85]|uniref:Panacea domain-containing protein n=1 Tax=Flavobacterium sp. LHD-85 TaxID=3071410 RepID=UPI0027E13C9F|nr:Panacea domain-containing protein [Flavobacterium sp. LHD-85]MDQ6528410.1 Panacea domain-containing protein [Flavobacterium sp. LHD-85]
MIKDFKIVFDEDRAINAVLYILTKLSRKDFHKIFKILFFADREHLLKYGRTITGDNYIAMNDGPVPSYLYDIFKSVKGNGYFKDNGHFSKYFSVVEGCLLKEESEPNLNKLSQTDLQQLNISLDKYGNMSWNEIRELSHGEAWINTVNNSAISFVDILKEIESDESYIDYLKEQNLLKNHLQ